MLANAGHLGAELEGHPLLAEHALEGLADLAIHARDQVVEIFDDGNLGSEPAPYGSQFETDIAAADDDEPVGDRLELERTGGGHDALFVDGHAGKRDALASRGDDDVLGGVRGSADADAARLGQFTVALEPGDAVLLEQELDSLDVGADDVAFALLHPGEIQGHAGDVDAVLREVVSHFLEVLGGLQHRLGRNAADVQARAAEGLAPLDAGDLQPELGGTQGGDIATGTGAEDDHVEVGRPRLRRLDRFGCRWLGGAGGGGWRVGGHAVSFVGYQRPAQDTLGRQHR